VYIVLSGKGRILEKGEWVEIATGDAILTGNGGSHSVENTGTEPLVIAAIIMVY
jgi:mannose-6-phosphate isomerase-like protein (cupin superfamily)